MRVVTGTRSDHAAGRLTVQACHALVWPPVDNDAAIVEGVAAMAEMAPSNGIEGMLAVQMLAAHNAALMFLSRATLKEQRPEAIDSNVIRTARLMRVFVEQADAMQKLKGKTGQQKGNRGTRSCPRRRAGDCGHSSSGHQGGWRMVRKSECPRRAIK